MDTKGMNANQLAERLNNAVTDLRTFAAAYVWYPDQVKPAEPTYVVATHTETPAPVAVLGIDGKWYQAPGYFLALNGMAPNVEVI